MSSHRDPLTFMTSESRMSGFERVNSHLVRLARAGNIEVKRDLSGLWAVTKGPVIPGIGQLSPHRTEAAAWRSAAQALLEYFCLCRNTSGQDWHQKSLLQQIELFQAFFADIAVSRPDEAFNRYALDQAKTLCQNVGWTVTLGQLEKGSKPKWLLNHDATLPFYSEIDAWQAGADSIRRSTMHRAGLSYVGWARLPVTSQVLLAKRHLLGGSGILKERTWGNFITLCAIIPRTFGPIEKARP